MKVRKCFTLLVLITGLFSTGIIDSVKAKSAVNCYGRCDHNFGCCIQDCGGLNGCGWWEAYNCDVAKEWCKKRCDADGVEAEATCPEN
jgi:hypothetical protein